MRFIEYSGQMEAAAGLSEMVSSELTTMIASRGMASLALAGGSTPRLFLQLLGKAPLDWSRINITTTDERLVAMDHARSNARLVDETLLQSAAAKKAFFALNSGASLQQLRQQFVQYFVPLDVCVLGMGDDGHTASLFPGIDEDLMAPNGQHLLAEVNPPGDLEPRYTLTARALLMAPCIHLLIHGENKKAVLDKALSGDDFAQMPVRCILHQAHERVVVHYA